MPTKAIMVRKYRKPLLPQAALLLRTPNRTRLSLSTLSVSLLIPLIVPLVLTFDRFFLHYPFFSPPPEDFFGCGWARMMGGSVVRRLVMDGRGVQPRDGPLADVPLRDASLECEQPRDALLQDAQPRDAPFRDGQLRGGSPRDVQPRDAPLRVVQPRDAPLSGCAAS